MAPPSSFQFPPPSNWQDFERLCCDLYATMVGSGNVQIHGSPGQTQNGVDIFFQDFDRALAIGIQCKGRDGRYGHRVTDNELREAIKEAKLFPTKLTKFVLMTSGKRDAKLQNLALEITELHQVIGECQVEVWAWEDILLQLDRYPDVARRRLRLNTEFSKPGHQQSEGNPEIRYEDLRIKRAVLFETSAKNVTRVYVAAIVVAILGFSTWIGVAISGLKGVRIPGAFSLFPVYILSTMFSVVLALRLHSLRRTGFSYVLPQFRKLFFELTEDSMYLSRFDATCPYCGSAMRLTIKGEWGKYTEEHFVCAKNKRQHSVNIDVTNLPVVGGE